MGTITVSSRIIKKLASPDPAKRRSAAEALSRGDERSIYPLIQALRDTHPGVQDAAMRSLISIGGEVAAWMILPLLRDEPCIRNTAMVILREIGKDTVPHLSPLFKDKDDDIRKFAIDLASEIGAAGLAEALAERLADDTNPNIRAAAAKGLGILGCRDALPQLIAALKDIEWVRFNALESLAGMREEAAVEPILALLSDSSPVTRYAAIEALGAIGSPRAGDSLLAHLGTAEWDERAVVLKSLLRMGVPLPGAGFREELLEIFRSEEEWEDRLVALRGLREITDEDTLRAIIDVAGSLDTSKPGNEEIICSIKEVLRGIGHPNAFRRIVADPSLKFRGKTIAVEIVGDLAISEAVPDLVALLKSGVRDVRRAAAYALGRIGNDDAREGLLLGIRDTDGHVRQTAVAALGAFGGKASFGPLLSLLREEKYGNISEEAVRALAAIDPDALVAACGSLDGYARDLVEAFARARLARNGAADPSSRVRP
jgi:HEAT repeat protein